MFDPEHIDQTAKQLAQAAAAEAGHPGRDEAAERARRTLMEAQGKLAQYRALVESGGAPPAVIGRTRVATTRPGVNAICPGCIDTPLAQAAIPTLDPMIRAMAGISFSDYVENVQGRWGTPLDIAGAAAFLASDDSTLVNGISMSIDGGISARVL